MPLCWTPSQHYPTHPEPEYARKKTIFFGNGQVGKYLITINPMAIHHKWQINGVFLFNILGFKISPSSPASCLHGMGNSQCAPCT